MLRLELAAFLPVSRIPKIVQSLHHELLKLDDLRLRFASHRMNSQPDGDIWIRPPLHVSRNQSISLHLRAKYSLGLIPVVKASANSTYHFGSSRPLRIAFREADSCAQVR